MATTLRFEAPCDAYYEIFTDKKQTGGYKYRYLSPFEFKDKLIELATKKAGHREKVLNAGRGNPVWFSTIPRCAFSLLNTISADLGHDECDPEDIGYMPHKKGIAKRFHKYLWKHRGTREGKFLKEAVEKMKRFNPKMSKDEFIHELVISTIGCFYPSPPRIQQFAEPVLNEFLDKTIYRPDKSFRGHVDLMPTEGAANGILYVFDSLKYNGLVQPGDTIAIMTPIFSPYLELPTLRNYDLEQVCIEADGNNNWEVPESELQKLADKKVRALFLVNPTNPTAISLSEHVVKRIRAIVRRSNPDLIILADNVYAPFVKEFHSLFNILPQNTIGVYSFSKYFGVTGWRLGVIAMHDTNIIDRRLLKKAPEDVNNRYKMLTTHPEKIKFIDRILADSRQVAEAHVAGLSTPQQVIMCLFAMYDLLDKKRTYDDKLQTILMDRMDDLLEPIHYSIPESPMNTNYYVVLNIPEVVNNLVGGTDFGDYLQEHRDPLEFLLKLAKEYATVCLSGVGFAAPFWSIRVSLANLPDEDYPIIGENIRSLIDDYYEEFQRWSTKKRREEERAAKRK